MKTITTLSILLLLSLQLRADPKPKPPESITAPVMLGILVLTVAAAGVYVVVKCHSTHANDAGPVNVVLEKSENNDTWTPVVTNTVVLAGTRPIDVFSEDMRNGAALFRARVLK